MRDDNQLDIFSFLYDKPKIEKDISLITLFSGYDSQALSLKYMQIPFCHHRTCEWAVRSIQALKDLHFEDDNTDYSKELTYKEVAEYLFKKGISADYNQPMTYEQIFRMGEDKCRKVYNNIIATHNMVNIQQVKADDLGLDDKHFFIMTYSFPLSRPVRGRFEKRSY